VNLPSLKRVSLFSAVLVLPALAVVIQGARIAAYEDDLARADSDELRTLAAERLSQHILGELERIKSWASAIRSPHCSSGSATQPYDGQFRTGFEIMGTVEWPWDLEYFADHSADEFDTRSAEEKLQQAKVAGIDEANRLYFELLELPWHIQDPDGIAYWTYAGLALLSSAPDSARAPVLDRMLRELRCPIPRDRAMEAQFEALSESISSGSDSEWLDAARTAANQLITRQEEYIDLEGVKANYTSMNVTANIWQAYHGKDLWLIGQWPGNDRSTPLVLAVSGEYISSRTVGPWAPFTGATLGTTGELPLGNELSGLRVTFPEDGRLEILRMDPDAPSFYEVTVVLAISLAILGAYFLWRDTQRESKLVALRSQFISGVSHELKTPLTSIRMFAETLQIADEAGIGSAAKRTEYLETIIRESERLTRLLNNVLAFSQIERGQRTYHMQRVFLQDTLDEVAQMMQFALSEQGFELWASISDDVPPIDADRDAIQQAILNLLSNAMKFSGKSRLIELGLFQQEGDSVITVVDHGIGIPKSEQGRIFDNFYRSAGAENRAIAGTGLGLAIVRHIAEAHGGSVSVESEPGTGSQFCIRIPIDQGAEELTGP
jgi:signal transduction histidine kinase